MEWHPLWPGTSDLRDQMPLPFPTTTTTTRRLVAAAKMGSQLHTTTTTTRRLVAAAKMGSQLHPLWPRRRCDFAAWAAHMWSPGSHDAPISASMSTRWSWAVRIIDPRHRALPRHPMLSSSQLLPWPCLGVDVPASADWSSLCRRALAGLREVHSRFESRTALSRPRH